MKKGSNPRSVPDFYADKAKKEGYPARSVYKLMEIQEKHSIIKPGYSILDLGAAPGSWSLYAAKITGPKGRVKGIDLKQISLAKTPDNITFYKGDIFDPALLDEICGNKNFNVVLSDAAPDTTGNKAIDSARSLDLSEQVLNIACKHLPSGGIMVVKIFQGGDFSGFLKTVREYFSRVKILKPKASRKDSFEIFVIGMDKKQSSP